MRKALDANCAIARSLDVLGERWTLLILRDAFAGATRFSQFRRNLKVAPDVLTARLSTLVDVGVLTRVGYQEPGQRERSEYRLTEAGHELFLVLCALQQWGDDHLPRPEGPSVLRRVTGTDRTARVGFLDDDGRALDVHDVAWRWATPDCAPKNGALEGIDHG
jgi:DNA-binding HxlR family transcriptional regulator